MYWPVSVSNFRQQLPSCFTIVCPWFPASFSIGSHSLIQGVPHRKITGSTEHLQSVVLSSLHGVRGPNPGAKEKMSKMSIIPFQMSVPDSMLVTFTAHRHSQQNQSIVMALSPPQNVHVSIIYDALLNPALDGPTVALLMQNHLATDPSPDAIRAVVKTAFEAMTFAPRDDHHQVVRRLLETCLYLPDGTCKKQLLAPISKAFEADALRRQRTEVSVQTSVRD